MHKLHGLDSKPIGVYSNDDLNQYYVLTDTLNMFTYNKKSLIMERKGDFKFAINTLYLKQTLEYLQSKNDCYKIAKNDHNVLEFEYFERIFK